MTRSFKGPPVFVAIIFLFIILLIYMSQTNERLMVGMPQIETRNNFVSPSSEQKTNHNKTRLNVIVLTHMSSGSTVVGNIFNLHPDVFYIYEPLHRLRRGFNKNEWRALPKSKNDVLRHDFSTLLPDSFTCGFHEDRTVQLVFPKWVRPYNVWFDRSTPLTKDWLRRACNARKMTVTKIMQTRLPREVGIRELERVCRSDPGTFDCLIVHLVRDPRAVLSSLLRRRFFMGNEGNLFREKPMSPEAISLLKQNAQTVCSLVSENLHHVNKEWTNWFKDRYILVRYEDAVSNMLKVADSMYKFVGLPMVDSITNWINGIPIPVREKARGRAMIISNNDTDTIDHWRLRVNSSLVSLFEEACGPLMKAMGYIFVNGSEQLQHNISKPLRTENIPFLRDLHSENS
ncbi:hypothetical protein ACROYT_G008452 [Oculina patagonica]